MITQIVAQVEVRHVVCYWKQRGVCKSS